MQIQKPLLRGNSTIKTLFPQKALGYGKEIQGRK
jgi:hypothetical protein